MSDTAIVILNWNGLEFLKMFLGKVIDLSASPDVSIYVVDNNSVDGSTDWVMATFPIVNVVRLDKNYGFAGGYNLALNQIKADYYVILNSDIEVTDDWLNPMISYLDQNPDVASCMPKVLSWKNREYFEYAGACGGYIDKYGYPFCRGRIFDKIEKDNGQYNTVTDIFWSTGACMCVRSTAWHECDGFDADFFAHMEEIDLCWRFAHAGYRISVIPESIVYHVGGGTLPYDSPFKTYLNFRNSLYLLYKNLEEKRIRIMFIRKILDGIAALRFLFKGKPQAFKAVFKAHIDFYRNLTILKQKRQKVLSKKIYNPCILNKSIVFEFYARGLKTFSQLNFNLK